MFNFFKKPKVGQVWVHIYTAYEAKITRVQYGVVSYDMLGCQCQCSIKEFKGRYEKSAKIY